MKMNLYTEFEKFKFDDKNYLKLNITLECLSNLYTESHTITKELDDENTYFIVKNIIQEMLKIYSQMEYFDDYKMFNILVDSQFKLEMKERKYLRDKINATRTLLLFDPKVKYKGKNEDILTDIYQIIRDFSTACLDEEEFLDFLSS